MKEIDIKHDLYLCSPLLNKECKKNNCYINGGHFYNREEMYERFSNMLKYYTFSDKFYDLKIWFYESAGDD